MILPIAIYPDRVLRAKCAPVFSLTDEIRKLADNMLETMAHAQGVGLAAPQVSVPIQLAVIDVRHAQESHSYLLVDGQPANLADIMPLRFINPKLEFLGSTEAEQEGCLSFPDIRAMIPRPVRVAAELITLEGRKMRLETGGLFSRAIQHETDHLNGRLFIDRMSSGTRARLNGQLKRMRFDYARSRRST